MVSERVTGLRAFVPGGAKSPLLLNHVRKLMGEQSLSLFARWRVGPSTEDNISPQGEGPCVQLMGGFSRAEIGVNPHMTEVIAKARFEPSSYGFR